MKKGKFIVFEGISGTGKETQARLLQKYLTSKNIKSKIVYHPTPELKDILRNWRSVRSISRKTECLLLMADRLSVIEQSVLQALDNGVWILSLRSYISALVYQGKTKKDIAWIMREFAQIEPSINCLLYFDIPPHLALLRILNRTHKTGEAIGKFENRSDLFKKRRRYSAVLKDIEHFQIDASKSISDIHRLILQKLNV